MTTEHRWHRVQRLGLFLLLCVFLRPAQAEISTSQLFPTPESLRPAVEFWSRVFAELDSNSGMLHDAQDVRVVYQTLTSLPSQPDERWELINRQRQRYADILHALADHPGHPSDADERRVFDLFPTPPTPEQCREAAARIRFQLGLQDRFLAGLSRSSRYLPTIETIFKAADLPHALTLLPHIESSFTNQAYSRAGAAGMWQLIRRTGRRFLTVDDAIDERLDVHRASQAAAQLLQKNYQTLGTWPLAITAYNHGVYGMKKAVAQLGTTDFGVIAAQYQSPTFGFASRNFYAEFLAVMTILNNVAAKFPKPLFELSPRYHTLELDGYVTLPTLETYLGVDRRDLSRWNPSLRRSLRRTYLRVPKGFTLRVLEERMSPSRLRARWAAVPSRLKFGQQLRPRQIQVRAGETLSGIATWFDTTVSALARANDLRRPYRIRVGQRLKLPYHLAASRSYRVYRNETLSSIAERLVVPKATLAKLNQLKPPYRLRVGQRLRLPSRETDYRRYWVQSGETLAKIAQHHDTPLTTLADLNQLSSPYMIRQGQLLRLPRSTFVALRRYQVRPGDTLSGIAYRAGTTLPLLAQLNSLKRPYLLRPGQVLRLPSTASPNSFTG